MNDLLDVERRLVDWMDATGPHNAPRAAVDAAVATTGRRRPRPRMLALLGEPPMRESSGIAVGSPAIRLAMLVVVTMAMLMAVGAAVVAGASLLSSPAPIRDTAVALETVTAPSGSDAELVPGVTYTSDLFRPRVSFALPVFGNGRIVERGTDWCLGEGFAARHPATSPRTLVLSWKMGCLWDLRLIRPYAVECGTPDAHPDAAALAAAILANPGMGGARDLGDLSAVASIAPGMDLSGYPGRVLQVERSRDFASDTDPDHCRLLPEPESADAVIEVRGDASSVLFLVDIDGELVVVRASDGGYDAVSGLEAFQRGYASPQNSFAEALPGMLATVHDFRFR